MSKKQIITKKYDLNNSVVLGKEREGLTLIKYKNEDGNTLWGYIDNLGRLLPNCPDLYPDMATDFSNGYAKAFCNDQGKTPVIISHKRSISGSKEGIEAISKLADLVYEDPNILLKIQSPLTLIDREVLNFLLDIVRYKFLDNINEQISKGDYDTSHQLDATAFNEKITQNFEKMKEDGLLDYDGLIESFQRLGRLEQRNLADARSYALNKYYLDLVDVNTLNSTLQEDKTTAEKISIDSVPVGKISSEDIAKYNYVFMQLEDLKLQINCHHSEIHQVLTSLSEILDESQNIVDESHLRIEQNPNDYISNTLSELLIEKLLASNAKILSLVSYDGKGQIEKIHDEYASLLDEVTKKLGTLQNIKNAYFGLPEESEPEEEPQQPYSLFD